MVLGAVERRNDFCEILYHPLQAVCNGTGGLHEALTRHADNGKLAYMYFPQFALSGTPQHIDPILACFATKPLSDAAGNRRQHRLDETEVSRSAPVECGGAAGVQ